MAVAKKTIPRCREHQQKEGSAAREPMNHSHRQRLVFQTKPMEMIVMRATTMGMKMPVLFAMFMPVRMEMDTLSPECKSH